MRAAVQSSRVSRLARLMALVLCGIGPAWAGDGGTDSGIQSVLTTVCTDLGMTTASCPVVPTITQAILQMSGLENAAPDFVRGPQGNIAAAGFFGSLCSVSSGTCQAKAINAVNPPAPAAVALSDLIPLAFTFVKGQGAVPVPLGTSAASSYFYAVLIPDQNGEFKTLTLFFDYPPLASVQNGKVVANVSLPLQLLKDGNERLICGAGGCPASVATLQISACSGGTGCVKGFAANVVGDFTTQGTTETRNAGALGIQTNVSFGPSPNSALSHLILEVDVPLLVTHGNDPAYFGVVPPSGTMPVNGLSGLPIAFVSDVVPASNIGVTPQAAPACPGGSCPPPTATTTYPFCASFASKGGGPLNPAVKTFLSIGTDATTYVSSPAQLVSTLTCPF